MSLNAPKLLRLLQEARAEIAELKSREPEVIEKVIERTVEVVVPQIKEVFIDREIHTVEYIDKAVHVPFEVKVPMYPPSVENHEVEVIKYVDNPEHIETIRQLKDQLCQFTSQSDSSSSSAQSGNMNTSAQTL